MAWPSGGDAWSLPPPWSPYGLSSLGPWGRPPQTWAGTCQNLVPVHREMSDHVSLWGSGKTCWRGTSILEGENLQQGVGGIFSGARALVLFINILYWSSKEVLGGSLTIFFISPIYLYPLQLYLCDRCSEWKKKIFFFCFINSAKLSGSIRSRNLLILAAISLSSATLLLMFNIYNCPSI